jgi:hypothetical protein
MKLANYEDQAPDNRFDFFIMILSQQKERFLNILGLCLDETTQLRVEKA